MQTITLVNEFHGTTREVKVGPISAATARRIHDDLCGSKSCKCGNGLGERGKAIGGHVEVDYRDGKEVFTAVAD